MTAPRKSSQTMFRPRRQGCNTCFRMNLEKPRRHRQWAFPDWREVLRDGRFQSLVALLLLTTVGWAVLAPSSAELAAEGRELFVHEWKPNDSLSNGGDGLGPVFNANSCVACHSQGGVGGAGDNTHNVRAYEVMPTRNDPEMHGGVVHAAATEGVSLETTERVNQLFPVVKGGARIIGDCTVTIADFDPVVFQEINTPALFGAGVIDDISGFAIRQRAFANRASTIVAELGGDFDRTPTGRVRILPDGRVGKFGWKAQFATLEEFVATACAVEVGLSNPLRPQDVPHEHRPDENAVPDMTSRQLRGLVEFCAQLESPRRGEPTDPTLLAETRRGEVLFTEVGCGDCHTPGLGGVEGLYSDLCLHSIVPLESAAGYGTRPEFPLPDDLPAPDDWKTPPLWGVADTAPYLHDGSAPTLAAAIEAHAGEARHVMERYHALPPNGRAAIVSFLKTLRAPAAPDTRRDESE